MKRICLALLSLAVAVTTTASLTGNQPVLSLAFRDRSAKSATPDGFDAFVMGSSSVGSSLVTNVTTRTYGALTVTVYDAMALGCDDRQRKLSTNAVVATNEQLFQNVIFPRGARTTNSLNVLIEGLVPHEKYYCTVWSFDSGSLSNRVSDWFANGKLVKQKYTFNGAVAPRAETDCCFEFSAKTDDLGEILIQGRRNPASVNEEGKPDLGVFLNAIRIAKSGSESASAKKQTAKSAKERIKPAR